VVIHCRTLSTTSWGSSPARPAVPRVFHAFSGMARWPGSHEPGFHIGWSVVTFKNARLRDVVRELPLGAFVLETDCPISRRSLSEGRERAGVSALRRRDGVGGDGSVDGENRRGNERELREAMGIAL